MSARCHWIATDLDGTLFSREYEGGAVPATWKRAVQEGGAPEPSSWMPGARFALFSGLVEQFRIVPVTARDWTSYSRVKIEKIPLNDGAIVSNGAILLQPGSMTPDPDWDAEVGPQLAEWAEPLSEMVALLTEKSGGRVVPRLVESHTPFPAYLVAKATVGYWSTPEGLELRGHLAPFGCRVAEIGRELQVLPPPVGKPIGVTAFMRRYCEGKAPLLALGDMPEDMGFLSQAAFMAAPVGSTLAERWCYAS